MTDGGEKVAHELWEAHAESRDGIFYMTNPNGWNQGPHMEGIRGENLYYRHSNTPLRRREYNTGPPVLYNLPGSTGIPLGR